MGKVGIIVVAMLSSSAYMMAVYILKILLPFMAKDMEASGILIARILYVGFIMFVFLPPIAGYISDKFGYRRTIATSAILSPC